MELESLDAAFVIDTFLLLLIGIGPKIALVPFLILGGLLTRLLHFSPGALGIASGIILLVIAANMVLGDGNGGGSGGHPVRGRDPMQVAVYVAVFNWAAGVASKLDASRMLVTEKVFGFLLAALAVQLVLNGLSDVGVIHLAGH